ISDGHVDVVWMILIAVLTGQGLHAALSKKGFEKDQKNKRIQKRVFSKLFGKWSSVMPWGSVFFFMLAWACYVWLPTRKWLMLLLLMCGFLYGIVLTIILCVHKGAEDE
ncbi:MAG TPA: hypothetical protein VN626_04480, partial [Clostridia bacterium]|nr:hypothetical protein [Clostridia bacterium]